MAAKPCRDYDHAYLARKQVQAYGLKIGVLRCFVPSIGTTVQVSGQALMLPMRDADGVLWAIQYILPHKNTPLGQRDKHFPAGCRKQGLFHTLGKDPTGTLAVAEGYATAATIYERTGHQTFVAFDAGNLLSVATAIRARHPKARIIIAADNDRFTTGNPGVRFATEAAAAVGGIVRVPQFLPDEPGTDWNDLAALGRWADEF
jgi:putative DNA primase/helicase